jgi:hypothetical protein
VGVGIGRRERENNPENNKGLFLKTPEAKTHTNHIYSQAFIIIF